MAWLPPDGARPPAPPPDPWGSAAPIGGGGGAGGGSSGGAWSGDPWGSAPAGPPGWPPQEPPTAPPPKWKGPVIFSAIVLVVALVGAGIGVVFASRTTWPSTWDDRVVPYVQFVEQERELNFEHPVEVEFLTPQDFDALVTSDSSETTDEDRAAYDEMAGIFRALGLHEGALDLQAETNKLHSSGILAYYSPSEQKVRVKGDQVTPEIGVTLVHELTHALQDQHFDLGRLDELGSTTASEAFRTVVEGDATWVEDRYRESLPADERKTVEDAEEQGSEDATEEVAALNDALVASFSAPYIFGAPFLELLHAEDGYDAVNAAITSPPPDEATILDPEDHFSNRKRIELPTPTLPEGAEPTAEGEAAAPPDSLGAVTLLMMLAARMDAHDAMAATDRVAGDTMVSYRENGRTCVALDVAGADDADAAGLEDALVRWADAMPEEADASVSRADDTVEVRSCDPGEDAEQHIEGDPSKALALPTARLYLVASSMTGGFSEDRAMCFATTFTDALTIEQITEEDADPAGIEDARSEAMAACPR